MLTPERVRLLRALAPWIAVVALVVGLLVAWRFENSQGYTTILVLVYVLAGLLTGLAEPDE